MRRLQTVLALAAFFVLIASSPCSAQAGADDKPATKADIESLKQLIAGFQMDTNNKLGKMQTELNTLKGQVSKAKRRHTQDNLDDQAYCLMRRWMALRRMYSYPYGGGTGSFYYPAIPLPAGIPQTAFPGMSAAQPCYWPAVSVQAPIAQPQLSGVSGVPASYVPVTPLQSATPLYSPTVQAQLKQPLLLYSQSSALTADEMSDLVRRQNAYYRQSYYRQYSAESLP